MDGAVYQKLSADVRHHGWQEIVTVTSSRDDTDPSIDASIEGFEHFELDIRERLRPHHSTKKNNVRGAELGRQHATTSTVAGICGVRESEQSERAENEHPKRFLHHVVRSFDPPAEFKKMLSG